MGGRCRRAAAVAGIDRHPWALAEAAQTYRAFGLAARTRHGDVALVEFPKSPAPVLAAFTVNELHRASRERLLRRLLDRAKAGRLAC